MEAASSRTLKGLGKNYTVSQIRRAVSLLHEYRIPITWYLLVGGPGETEEALHQTYTFVKENASKWDLVNIGVGVRLYNGAPVIEGRNPDEANRYLFPVSYDPKEISLERVKQLTKEEALRQSNFFMYDEDENTPLFLLKAGNWFFSSFFSPPQPVWRLFIVKRICEKALGINRIKQALYSWRTRRSCRNKNIIRLTRDVTADRKIRKEVPGKKCTQTL